VKTIAGAVVNRDSDESLRAKKAGPEPLTSRCHEMLTQLTVISLSCSMLRETLGDKLPEKQLQLFGKIEHGLDDLFSLIRDLDRVAGNQEASRLT